MDGPLFLTFFSYRFPATFFRSTPFFFLPTALFMGVPSNPLPLSYSWRIGPHWRPRPLFDDTFSFVVLPI